MTTLIRNLKQKYIFLLIITSLLFLLSCGQEKPVVIQRRPYSPWKIINFKKYFSISCPNDWKVRRDKYRLFLRPHENKPIGIVINVEPNRRLNRLPLHKYFIHFYKNIAIPNKIKIEKLTSISFNDKKGIKFNYEYVISSTSSLKGYKIVIKHKDKFISVVTEAPKRKYNDFTMKFNWIIENFRLIN